MSRFNQAINRVHIFRFSAVIDPTMCGVRTKETMFSISDHHEISQNVRLIIVSHEYLPFKVASCV